MAASSCVYLSQNSPLAEKTPNPIGHSWPELPLLALYISLNEETDEGD